MLLFFLFGALTLFLLCSLLFLVYLSRRCNGGSPTHFLFGWSQSTSTLETEKEIVSLVKRCPSARVLRQIHSRVLTTLRPSSAFSFLLSKILSFYAISPLGDINYACKVLLQIPTPAIYAYNSILRGFLIAENPSRQPIYLFRKIVKRGYPKPNTFTLAFALKACSILAASEEGRQVHACVIRSGFGSNAYVQTALLNFYVKCEDIEHAEKVFEEITDRNLISWSAMISGYARVGMVNEALGLFREMQKVGVEPDEVSLVSVISACAAAGALDIGRWIHAFINRRMINMDLELSTSLVNMYAKCGCIEKAKEIFDEMPVKDSKAWSSMINAFAIHGLGGDAVEEYTRMKEAKVKPNHITFLGLLSACARGGLISEGQRFWSAMLELGIEPSLEHYGCMIDLLCRVGLVDEAFRFVETKTVPADPAICRTLLLGCKKNGLLQQAQIVSNHLLKLEPLNPENYIIVANFYASASQWEMMSHVRKQMKETGIKTVPGCSSIEVGGLVHEFIRGGQSHPEAQEIKEFLKDAYVAIHDTGHKPIVSSELPNVGEEVKEDALYEHSESLAIAYGLLKTKAPAVIRIMKNLRLCEDCHEVAKFLSKIYEREIIVRDLFCLHKFFDGKCSCADYW